MKPTCDCAVCKTLAKLLVTSSPNCDCDKCNILRLLNAVAHGATPTITSTYLAFPRANKLIGFNKDELEEMLAEECPNNPPALNKIFLDKVFERLKSNTKVRLNDDLIDEVVQEMLSDQNIVNTAIEHSIAQTVDHSNHVKH